MSHASKELGITRGAVGQNIRELEKQLGVTLFVPYKKGVAPTSEATDIYPSIKKATEQIIETESKLGTLNSASTGIIKMVVHSWFAKNYLDNYLPIFCAEYPKIQIQIFQDDGLQMLKNKKIDFIIDFDVLFANTDIKQKVLLKETFYDNLVASKDFLAKSNLTKEMKKKDLQKLPIIARAEVWQEYKKQFSEPIDTVINVPNIDAVYSMVKKSMGIGVLGQTQYQELNDLDIVELNVEDLEILTASVSCGYENLSRPAKTFIDGLIKFCQA